MSSPKTTKNEQKVIAHLLDGTLLKGFAPNFYPSRSKFELTTEAGHEHTLHVAELKALFFVHDFDGRHDYRERKGFFVENGKGSKVLVEFFDGEVLFGHTLSYKPNGLGFFVTPGDPDSNNIKVFVVNSSTKRVKLSTTRAPAKKKRRKKTRTKSRA
jgi:hypothetical protein